jgi:ribose transport system permease protein
MAETSFQESKQEKKKVGISNTLMLFIVLVIIIAFFGITSQIKFGQQFFFSVLNLIPMLSNISYVGIIACVLTMLLITGEIDFSIGGNIGLTGCLAALLLSKGINGVLVVLICLAAGTLMGVFNGFIVTRLGVNSIIATIGTMSIWRGIGYTLSNGESMLAFNPVIDYLGRGTIFKYIPFPIVLFIIVIIVTYIIMNKSKVGRRIYAIGVNPMASYLSGTNVRGIKFLLFIFCGAAASLGGLMLTSLSAVGMPQHGQGLELTVVSAVILGGTALSGGKGQILGTLAGVLILSVLYNGLTMLNIMYFYIQIVRGIVLILVVATYEIRQSRALRRV